MMPRNPIEADWLIRCAEEDAARAERRAAIAQQHAAYQIAVAKAHAADAVGLRALWNFEHLPGLRPTNFPDQPPVAVVETPPPEPAEEPKCEFCGKPTRIWHGQPQRFCSFPKTAVGYSCAHRWRDRRDAEIRKKARAGPQAVDRSEVSCTEVAADPPKDPWCQQCGKPTRIWRRKPGCRDGGSIVPPHRETKRSSREVDERGSHCLDALTDAADLWAGRLSMTGVSPG